MYKFHPWRYPVPGLWRDLLEKIKAAGFNTFSIYTSWAYHSASPDSLDFTNGGHNFTSILSLAKELGMYTAAWKPYWETVSSIVEPYLVTNGGNVLIFQVENELDGQWKDVEGRIVNPTIANYMQLLQDSARDSGIDVPLTHNAPGMSSFSWSKDYSNATGNVDVVGVDSYPSCWSCNISECTGTNGEYVPYQTLEYYTYFTLQSPSQPNFLPEFQGGSYNPWGGPQGGCPTDIGVDFANLFYRNLVSQQATAISLYMLFGGTNWGHLACPVVASSYDYSSPVSENRALWDKYYETKLLVLFTRAAHDLTHTNRVGNGTNYTTNEAITTAELRNPETNGAFYVVMQNDSTSDAHQRFKLDIDTTEGKLTVPQFGDAITINGHQAKILVTDFSFGKKKLLYSTAEVLSYAVIDGKEVLALWLPEGEAGELTVQGASKAEVFQAAGDDAVALHEKHSGTTVSYVQHAGVNIIQLADGARILMLGRKAAYRFWVPTLNNDPSAPADNSVLVQGPYLVRSAAYDQDKRTLDLTGDEEEAKQITIFATKELRDITWNGKKSPVESSNGGMYVVSIEGASSFELPLLGSWKWADSLPEVAKDYRAKSDAWVVANKHETPNPSKPAANNPVLYVDDYKIHYGNHIYRATFPTTEDPPTGIFLNLTGGFAFGYSVWLNSDYVGSYYGLSYKNSHWERFSFDNATLKGQGDNVLVVLMDQSGHELREAAVEPRGISNATLVGPGDDYNFTEWRIAGNAGREENIDPMRGPMNEGGLYAERVGMHLPGYPDDDDSWTELSSNSSTLIVPAAGVRAFRAVAHLDVPKGLDVSISFRLTSTSDETFTPSHPAYTNRLRALLFVNGYQYGRFSPYIGNQIDFPVPPGILDYHGDNTIAVTVWSQAAEGVEMKVEWVVDYVHATSFDVGFESAELRPGWTEDRLEYA